MNKTLLFFGFLLLTQPTFGQDVSITDSIWKASFAYKTKQLQAKLYTMAKEGHITVYRKANSKNPIHISEFEQLGRIQMQVASASKDGSDSLIEIPLSTESFVGIGFNRSVSHSLQSSSTTIQLDYISIIYKVEQDGLYFNQNELFYVSMIDITAALPLNDLNLIRTLDLMAKRLRSFEMTNTSMPYGQKSLTDIANEVIEQKVIISRDLFSEDHEENKALFKAINDYMLNRGLVYTTLKLKKSLPNSSEARMVTVSLHSKDNEGDYDTYKFPLNAKTCVLYLTRSNKGEIVIKLTPGPTSDKMELSFIDQEPALYIQLSSLMGGLSDETRIHVQTIVDYIEDHREN